MKRTKYKTILAIVWFIFTFSLVTWWWIYGLHQLSVFYPPETSAPEFYKKYNMLKWEGIVLLFTLFVGGISLIFFTYQDQQRVDRLKLFFSTFSHDIKTSISRLRLQAEVLQESKDKNPKIIERLIKDITILDLQLENSLWLSNFENYLFKTEKVSLKEIISSLKIFYPEIQIELEKEISFSVDKKALELILKNLIHNSILHGQSDTITFQIVESKKSFKLLISDNGKGCIQPLTELGQKILNSSLSKSNGIGLYLSRQLLKKMQGELGFPNKNSMQKGFQVEIMLPLDGKKL